MSRKTLIIPKHFYLEGEKWRVKYDDQLTPKEQKIWLDHKIKDFAGDPSGDNLGGTCIRKLRLIILKRGLSSFRTREIFAHEMLHAIIETGGYKIDSDAEEKFVQSIETPLLKVIQQLRCK
jgi:Zn-dependent peptidase ImmA (M78 family)